MKKKEFIKKLKKEKNPIFKYKKYSYLIMFLILPSVLMYVLGFLNIVHAQDIQESKAGLASVIIYTLSILIAIAIEVDINRKTKKMYKEYNEGKEYNETQKGFIIIPLVILAILGAIITSDFAYSFITDNKPILSIKDEKENNKYNEKYKAIFYDYYKDNESIAYLRLKNSEFKRDYAERITIAKYIENFNNNLKLANIDKTIDLYDYIYIDGEYIWILDETKLELRLGIEEGKIDHKVIEKEGNIDLAYLICFDEEFMKNEFDNYAKVFIKSDTQWYSQEEVNNIYIKANEGEHEEDGIIYEITNNENNKILFSNRIIKDSKSLDDIYVHTSLNNFLQVTLPMDYKGIEQEGDKYELYCRNEEIGAEIFASYYVKDVEEYFHMTEEDVLNRMIEDCNNKFTDIEKISEINTVVIDNKEIKEVIYTGKYNENKIIYKISGFKTGKTNEYIVGACYLIDENLYEEKKKELDNIRNSIKDDAGNMYIGVKVENEDAVYEKIDIENLFSINLPTSFEKLSKEDISRIAWQGEDIPEVVYAKPDFTTYMAVQILENEEEINLQEFVEGLGYKAYLDGVILSEEIKKINGNDVGVVKYTLENDYEERYYHLIVFENKNKVICVAISTRRDLMSQWNWVAEEMMESIEIK